MAANPGSVGREPKPAADWRSLVYRVAVSRALDDLEESTLLPARKVLYQFSARGHDVTQTLLGGQLTGLRDGVGAYYRSRPLLLSLGLSVDDALASTMMRVGGMSEGRDIGVVFNFPRKEGACVLPVCGGVGTQYTPAVGWAQSVSYTHLDVYKRQMRLTHIRGLSRNSVLHTTSIMRGSPSND